MAPTCPGGTSESEGQVALLIAVLKSTIYKSPFHPRRRILQTRGVQPLSAEPAIATCATLAFRHVGGYATLVPLTSAALQQPSSLECAAPHGVLLRLKSLDFAKLVAFEGGYNVRGLTVETYDGHWVAARAFSSQRLVLLRASLPPTERY